MERRGTEFVRAAATGDDRRMSLIPLPTATIDDSDVARVRHYAVGLINPVLDLLAGVDLLGLKKRTGRQWIAQQEVAVGA
jgi:hypothetical protein